MRLAIPILLAAGIGSHAAAQTAFDTLHLENRLAAREALARQRALAADREAAVLESRLRTAQTLRSLESARLATTESPLSPLALAPLDPQLAADLEAVAKAQVKALEASNARIRAIKPASED